LVRDLYQRGAYIYNFQPGNIAVNENVPCIHQGVLWIDFQNVYWREYRHVQSVPKVMRELVRHFFVRLHQISAHDYKLVFEQLVLRVHAFRQKHSSASEFPSEVDFYTDCLQGLFDEYSPLFLSQEQMASGAQCSGYFAPH
jgi:hypothetical protein